MAAKRPWKRWLWEQRNSARLAYLIQLTTRLATSFMALIWIRLLVGAMGQGLNGLYLSFQNFVTLGGLGDMGMGGAVNIRTGQYLGQGKTEELQKFLATARTVFLIFALAAGGGILMLSPWLPHWLRFRPVHAAGTVAFAASDVNDLPTLARQLKSPTNEISRYLGARLSDHTVKRLAGYQSPARLDLRKAVAVDLQYSLVADFNRLAEAGPLYEPQRFAGIKFSPRTVELLAQNPAGAGLTRLNRQLLLDAYPHSLIRNQSSGPLSPVFAIGALMIAGVLLSSYLSNLNYACGNVLWPIVPLFLLLQLTMFSQWLLARQGQPLWMQYIPYVAASGVGLWLTWAYVRLSHPPLARIWAFALDWRTALSLFESSFWIYLCSLGNAIYRNTDSLVINAGFGSEIVPVYQYNYKFCELAVFLALAASLVSLPKITQWMASKDPRDRERVKTEMRRLNQFQVLLGCTAALGYLAINDLFMKLWWLHNPNPIPPAPLAWQMAFALNLVVTTCGDTGIQMALRAGPRSLRVAGMAIGLTGLLNLGLSIVSMELGSIWGIAMATVLAQSILSLVASFYTCRHLEMTWLPWVLRGWLFPLLGILLATWLRHLWPLDSLLHALLLGGSYTGLVLAAAWGLGVTPAFIRGELGIVQKFFKK